MSRTLRRAVFLCLAALLAPALRAQEASPAYDPFFLGYETEPGMDYGGRTLSSVQSAIGRAIGSLPHVDRHPGLAPAWEFPIGAFLTVVQHEVDGHGGRAREFGLGPSYGFGFDFSGYTTTRLAPATHTENMLIGTAGVESDGMMARRILLDALRPEGTDGAKIPLAFMGKLDLSLYVSEVRRPASDAQRFVDQYRQGNDMAFYLVARQAARRGARPADAWNGEYVPDPADPLLRSTYDDLRKTAIWNALDPSLAAAVYAYFYDHVLGGQPRVHPPVWHVGEGLALTVGTRGALGPQSVSRYLDLYGVTGNGVVTVYVRDLDSTVDRTYGFGAGIHGVRYGRLSLGLAADAWKEPAARELLGRDLVSSSWNVDGEIEAPLGARWGLAAKLGAKSRGFLPGKPQDRGAYVGFGLTAVW